MFDLYTHVPHNTRPFLMCSYVHGYYVAKRVAEMATEDCAPTTASAAGASSTPAGAAARRRRLYQDVQGQLEGYVEVLSGALGLEALQALHRVLDPPSAAAAAAGTTSSTKAVAAAVASAEALIERARSYAAAITRLSRNLVAFVDAEGGEGE